MKRLKLIPQSWRPTDVVTPRVPKTPPTLQSPTDRSPRTPTEVVNGLGELEAAESPGGGRRERQPSGDVMQTPVIDRMLSSERLIKLRESLSNITKTPVRTLLPGKTSLPPRITYTGLSMPKEHVTVLSLMHFIDHYYVHVLLLCI